VTEIHNRDDINRLADAVTRCVSQETYTNS